MTTPKTVSFSDLDLGADVLKALSAVGYETPSPIQAQTIPMLLAGSDLVGQAQTGTGKTAAFALPILSKIDLSDKAVQVLVLAPTRELAIQVAEAFQTYAKFSRGFRVLPIYGGQDYKTQLRALERGVNVVVGTPGRVMDHMRRGTLKLDSLKTLVLDEADEMLRMGFIDDVEWILEKTPAQRQIALFSATMPPQIRRIATTYLNNPEHVTIKSTTSTASTIRQRFLNVKGPHKLDALTRIIEAESFDAMIVFVKTKRATVEVSEKLEARGYAIAALNGDIVQSQRERTVDNLKKGKIDIIVATDVAARGLDVSRISHVINYDIPSDNEAYIHRIGRTGRAGRHGDAILFVAPRESRTQYAIEKATGKTIEPMKLPSNDEINERRVDRFKQRISDTIESDNIKYFEELIASYHQEHQVPYEKIAAALAQQMQGKTPFLFLEKPPSKSKDRKRDRDTTRDPASERSGARGRDQKNRDKSQRPQRPRQLRPLEKGMERFRMEVGSANDVKPSNIVGAIANEAGIDSQYIGQIVIDEDHSLIDLPEGMPKAIFNDLKKTRVCGVPLKLSRFKPESKKRSSEDASAGAPKNRKPKKNTKPKRDVRVKGGKKKKSRVKKPA